MQRQCNGEVVYGDLATLTSTDHRNWRLSCNVDQILGSLQRSIVLDTKEPLSIVRGTRQMPHGSHQSSGRSLCYLLISKFYRLYVKTL